MFTEGLVLQKIKREIKVGSNTLVSLFTFSIHHTALLIKRHSNLKNYTNPGEDQNALSNNKKGMNE